MHDIECPKVWPSIVTVGDHVMATLTKTSEQGGLRCDANDLLIGVRLVKYAADDADPQSNLLSAGRPTRPSRYPAVTMGSVTDPPSGLATSRRIDVDNGTD